MEKYWGIYEILNTVNNKRYIGSSCDIDKRWKSHRCELRNNKHINKHLQYAWNKYGEDAFKFNLLEEIIEDDLKTNEYLRNLETEYILKYQSYVGLNGYNSINGGKGTLNTPCKEETKQKISESNKGKKAWNKNVPMTDEQKQLLIEVKTKLYGKLIDVYDINGNFIETMPSVHSTSRKYHSGRNSIVDSCNGYTLPKNYIYRYHGDSLDTVANKRIVESEEHCKQRKEEYRERRGKKIDVYTLTGEYIETLTSISEVAKKYNVSESIVRSIIHYKATSRKFIFREKNDKTNVIYTKPHSNCFGDTKYVVYKNNDIVYQCKFRNKLIAFLLYGRNLKKLTKLIQQITPDNDTVVYNDFIIKLEPALTMGDHSNVVRQP